MKILVTGGAGFIGSNYIDYVLTQYPKDTIINVDALTYAGNKENCKKWENDSRYTFVHGDITDAPLVQKLVAQVDVIVHFAAESHVDRSIDSSMPFAQTNVIGTLTLLEAAHRAGNKRFHHISTDEVFGHLGKNDPPFTEQTPYDPSSPYSASKAASDHFVRSYHRTHGLPITISNCTNNYGPFHHPEKLIPLTITHVLTKQNVPVYGTGEQVRDWLHVHDHVRAIDMIVRDGNIGETYGVGGNNQPKNIDIVRMIIKELGARPEDVITFVKDRKGHDFRYDIDYTKIKTQLGWTPSVTLEEGLRATIDWYVHHEDWWRPLISAS